MRPFIRPLFAVVSALSLALAMLGADSACADHGQTDAVTSASHECDAPAPTHPEKDAHDACAALAGCAPAVLGRASLTLTVIAAPLARVAAHNEAAPATLVPAPDAPPPRA